MNTLIQTSVTLMFFEGWFRVGDTIRIERWNVEGVGQRVTLR
jgi:hypothetical protein